jgi:putative transposase
MSSHPRIVLPGYPHHVTLRGNNQRILFSQHDEYEQFLFYAARAKQKVPVEIYAATLMTNHVHLVVTTPDETSLSKFVQLTAGRYAQFRNAKKDGSGKLYEERFHAVPILDDRQLAVTLAYVELNIVRAGVPSSSPKHRWTTYWNHVGATDATLTRSLWTPSPWYLELGSTDEERARRYAEWVEDCAARGEKPADVSLLEMREAKAAAARGRALRRPDGTRAR